MSNILNTLYDIANTQGTNNKKVKLKEWYDKQGIIVKEVLNFLYNPNITTNMSKKKINKNIITVNNWTTSDVKILKDMDILHLMTYLIEKCTGTDVNITYLQEYINNYAYVVPKEFFQDFLCKELSIGLDIKNINSVIDNCIMLLEPMLAMNYTNVIDKIKEEDNYYFTLKLDGNRVLIDTRKEAIKAYSRNGVELTGLDSFLKKLNLPVGNIYDGEILPNGMENKPSSEQYKAISSIMRTKGEKDPEQLVYNLFDIYDSVEEYKVRRDIIDRITENKYLKIVPVLHFGKIDKQVFELLDKVVSEGQEGLMANLSTGVYENKRTANILKFKKFNDVDLKVIDVLEGQGKYKGTLGNIVVEYKGNSVGVGSGFTDEQRHHYWNNKDTIIGKIVKIKYFEETQDKQGNLSIRFPVFMEVREDKNEVSYN